MSVNKRREPTTAPHLTRRHVRRANFHSGGETWRVVRALREIATSIRPARPVGPRSRSGAVGWNFSQVGNLPTVSFVLLYGKWGRNGPQEPHPAPRRRKTAQAGQSLGVGILWHRGERSAGGGE
ncbi:hypothetical protein AV521_28670 [Streptomyces sp. IMTB 2501]|nr:hypothetical protein AV521_28670 [Streptomyces sp. IMTB 2501]